MGLPSVTVQKVVAMPIGDTGKSTGQSLRERLTVVDEELCRLGATPEFVKGYFEGGVCEMRGGVCRRHSKLSLSLPPYLMCSAEYADHLGMLKSGVLSLQCTILARRDECKVLQSKESVDSLFSSNPEESAGGGSRVGGVGCSSVEAKLEAQHNADKVSFFVECAMYVTFIVI